MSDEEWRPIPGYPLYEASSLGRIRSFYSGAPLVMKPYFHEAWGRWCLTVIREDGTHSKMNVHRLVAYAFLGVSDLPVVRHLNDDPHDNSAANLAWGTQADNMQDMVRNGHCASANKTQCKRGHPFDERNTYLYRGKRGCRKCRQAATSEYNARKAASS